jgi:hypothetical protein
VVNLVEDWSILAEYAGEKLGFYQLIAGNKTFQVRVQTGRLGFIGEFSTEDPVLQEIKKFCEKRFIKVSEHIRDEDFFK